MPGLRLRIGATPETAGPGRDFLDIWKGESAMLHEPAAPSGVDNASGYKTRLGVVLFIVYALVYAGFVAISLYDVTIMETTVFSGLNLAVVYGFGLIVFALVMALVYSGFCSRKERELNESPKAKKRAKAKAKKGGAK
jgi:uncharacterized membrane protein (DUF485 family)